MELTMSSDKESYLYKKGARMGRWLLRYWILTGPKISYKLKQDSPIRGTFDLAKGCIVTEVFEDADNKLFTFWLMWPEIDEENPEQNYTKPSDLRTISNEDSDGEKEDNNNSNDINPGERTYSQDTNLSNAIGDRDFRKIVETEVKNQRTHQKLMEQEVEKHQLQDSNMSKGVKVAAVAVGGVVVGALTAGIGLLPYITVVGLTAVASGGAVLSQYRRPSDNRLILACETMAEAIEWKEALSLQISSIDSSRSPHLPQLMNPQVISDMIEMNTMMGGRRWKKVGTIQGMTILEHNELDSSNDDPLASITNKNNSNNNKSNDTITFSRKAQYFIRNKPLTIFLALMETMLNDETTTSTNTTGITTNTTNTTKKSPSSSYSMTTLKILDDHADILAMEIHSENLNSLHSSNSCLGESSPFSLVSLSSALPLLSRSPKDSSTKLCLNRFWKVDDDGTYLVSLNTIHQEDYNKVAQKTSDGSNVRDFNPSSDIKFDIVFTIAPRRDSTEYDSDLMESLMSCTMQVSTNENAIKSTFGTEMKLKEFMNEILGQIVELEDSVTYSRFYRINDTSDSLSIADSLNTTESNTIANTNSNTAIVVGSGNIHTNQPHHRHTHSDASDIVEHLLGGGAGSPSNTTAGIDIDRNSFNTQGGLGLLVSSSSQSSIHGNEGRGLHSHSNSNSSLRESALAAAATSGSGTSIGTTGLIPNNNNSSSNRPKHIRKLNRGRTLSTESINAEASSLKGEIAAKEYGINRLQIALMRSKTLENHDNINNQLIEQTEELKILKDKYEKLTGLSYHQNLYEQSADDLLKQRGSVKQSTTAGHVVPWFWQSYDSNSNSKKMKRCKRGLKQDYKLTSLILISIVLIIMIIVFIAMCPTQIPHVISTTM